MRHTLITTAGPLFAAGLLLAGCATQLPGIDDHPGLEAQIKSYYEANAEEHDGQCVNVVMQNIDRTHVVEDTPEKLELAVNYYFEDPGMMANRCRHFMTRIFTFDKSSDGLTVASMTGDKK